jgi:hypothetical protein
MNPASLETKPTTRAGLPPAVPPWPVYRFTVDEYHNMIEAGVITEDHRVELIHGWIVAKMGINPPHNTAVNRLMKGFLALTGPDGVVRIQQPVTTPDSEPEPDVVLATGTDANYTRRNPRPSECIVVAEVAETTLREDQTTKLQLYAGAKVTVYWIINLVDRRVEVYTQPRGGKIPTYKTRTDYGPDDAVPVEIAGRRVGAIAVKELLL